MKEFVPFPKIPRYKGQGIVITEKIDGTNAQIYIGEDGELLVGSRTRWITPTDDNFGFARFVYENEESVRKLGLGHHYGEWWGPGIQRGYNLPHKVFSLFNTFRHDDVSETTGNERIRVVPTLYKGAYEEKEIIKVLLTLEMAGSFACPGYLRPEGIVIYHMAARQYFKYTLEGDSKGA